MREVKFGPIFLMCYVLSIIGIFIIGFFSAISFWVLMILPALFFAMLIYGFIKQETKMEELEKRIQQLENEKTENLQEIND